MEGDISKHNSTESVASSGSHLGYCPDDMLDQTEQMSDCLAASHALVSNQFALEAELAAYQYTYILT